MPGTYSIFLIIFWNNLCQTIHLMSIGIFIILVCGLENSLLPFKLMLSETKELHLPVTILLWTIKGLEQMTFNDCKFTSMHIIKQIF